MTINEVRAEQRQQLRGALDRLKNKIGTNKVIADLMNGGWEYIHVEEIKVSE